MKKFPVTFLRQLTVFIEIFFFITQYLLINIEISQNYAFLNIYPTYKETF